jgi:hypothetical protein
VTTRPELDDLRALPVGALQAAAGRELALNGGLTQPDTQATDVDGATASGINHTPDFAFNLRGESADSTRAAQHRVPRSSAKSATLARFGFRLGPQPRRNPQHKLLEDGRRQTDARWPIHLRRRAGRYGNDSGSSHRRRLQQQWAEGPPYYGASAAIPTIGSGRSTGTFGWVKVDGLNTPDRTRITRRVRERQPVWQLRERLSVGCEPLYGNNQKESAPVTSSEPGRRRVLDLLE